MKSWTRAQKRVAGVTVLAGCFFAATPATAGMKQFEGKLKVNASPVEFEVEKRDGRYRHIPILSIGEPGVPVKCEGSREKRPIDYGQLDVDRKGRVDEGDGFARIKGEFESRTLFKGTIKINGVGQGTFCTSNGPLKFKAKLVP